MISSRTPAITVKQLTAITGDNTKRTGTADYAVREVPKETYSLLVISARALPP
jgi:hypothetical protein